MARNLTRTAVLWLAAVVVVAVTGWGAAAIYFGDSHTGPLQTLLAGAFGLAGVATIFGMLRLRWRGRLLGAFLALFAVLLLWWNTMEPSNDRNWQPEVAVLSYATIDGDRVKVHNIRNFDYRTETDFTSAYYDKTFDLRKLEGVDVVASYWMGPAIAHVFLSFAFTGGDHLAISIEARKAKDEGYSTIKGFFRQYELYYVVADERDVIRLRTNYRRDPPEDVYLFRAHGPVANGRRLFLEYMDKLNSLKTRPEFYNSLTTNCTTNIWTNTRVNPEHLPFNWKVLVSGHVPEYLYEQGRLETGGLPFPDLQRRAHINARAQPANNAADFSARIRAGLPEPKTPALP
ncbi:MAG: Lnb N-terminal periplasmic domain-containing protein [Betaproteobacteria bacterium]